jgi:transcriptional regulator with XRE-family HTH domain
MERFGEKLHFLRKKHHITLQALATELGYIAHSHMSQIEAGKKKPTGEGITQATPEKLQRIGKRTDFFIRFIPNLL